MNLPQEPDYDDERPLICPTHGTTMKRRQPANKTYHLPYCAACKRLYTYDELDAMDAAATVIRTDLTEHFPSIRLTVRVSNFADSGHHVYVHCPAAAMETIHAYLLPITDDDTTLHIVRSKQA